MSETDADLVGAVWQPDGAEMSARLEFTTLSGTGLSYSRKMPPEEYGRWVHGLASAIGVNLGRVRLRIESGHIIGIGHATEDRWFDPRAPHEQHAVAQRVSLTASALRHINAHRARSGMHPLNPKAPAGGAAPWTDDDVQTEALALGWRPDR